MSTSSRFPLLHHRNILVALVTLTALSGAIGTRAAFAQDGSGVNLAGCWPCGSWQSHCTGHQGNLRATIVQCDAAHFECHFSGSFFKVVPFRYSVVLTVTGQKDGVVYFQGQKSLGRLVGGVYTFSGWANNNQFHADYVSSKDRGVFAVNR